MIIYNPHDGDAYTASIPSNPRHCFLMTRLGNQVPQALNDIRQAITRLCQVVNYEVVDASSRVTGRDFLLKIWKLIASAPLSIGICHEVLPAQTQENIYYEIGVAQALGKETLIIKSPNANIPSDFVRTEYIEYNDDFENNFTAFLNSVIEQAEHYEFMASLLDRNPILAIDYLKRAFLINGEDRLRREAKSILEKAGLKERAKNSVELLAAEF
jgi:hypothetical protein